MRDNFRCSTSLFCASLAAPPRRRNASNRPAVSGGSLQQRQQHPISASFSQPNRRLPPCYPLGTPLLPPRVPIGVPLGCPWGYPLGTPRGTSRGGSEEELRPELPGPGACTSRRMHCEANPPASFLAPQILLSIKNIMDRLIVTINQIGYKASAQ